MRPDVRLFLAAACVALPLTLLAAPRIDSISPTQGPIAGGTDVVVSGAGFTGATVRLDSTTVTPLSLTDTSIRLRTPAHDNGYAVINVRSGTSNAYAEFLYVPPRLEDLPVGTITTVAGVGQYYRDFGPATQATVFPCGLALDASGNLYIAESANDKVSRVRPDGTIERVTAVGPRDLPIGDGGPAVDGKVWFPLAVAVDPAGNLYIPDHTNRIRRVDAQTGIITTLAGDGIEATTGDNGPAQQARVGNPTHIAADANDVFFLDYDSARIRRIHFADGRITTFAGNGTRGFSGDGGPATQAQFDVSDLADAGYLALDAAGNLYLADTANYRIRRIDRTTGIITTVCTLPTNDARPEAVHEVRSLALDRSGNIYYGGSGRIVKVSPAGEFLKSWGNGRYELPIEGSAAATSGLGHVTGLVVETNGNIIYSDDAIGRVRRIDIATEKIFTVAGIGPASIGETGPALAAVVNPLEVAFDHRGNLLIGDASLRLRRMDQGGNLSTIAGTGSFVGQPPPTLATSNSLVPYGIEIDANDEIDVVATNGVAHIDRAGILRMIAGGGSFSYTGDAGPAVLATFCQPWDGVRDAQGNLLIADTNNNRIRRVDARTGIITTIVGNGGPINGFERYAQGKSNGDGGLAIDAAINTPYGIAVDASGNLYIAEDTAIRKVDPSGRISTLASIRGSTKVICDAAGNVYAGVPSGVVRIEPSGKRVNLAGDADRFDLAGFFGDGGPATQARVHLAYQAAGLAIDAQGNLYFCDDHRVRVIRGAAPAGPQRFPPLPARLSNVSVRTAMAANQTLIVGLTTSGGARDVLLRAAGPALANVGVATPMADPRLDLFNGASALLRSNDNWDASLANTFTSVGAFAFPAGSKDAALVHSLDGGYTVQARGTGAGIVLVEAYDLGSANSPRLTNASVRNLVGTGANILIAGFTVTGTGTKPLLIRAVGPKLAAFGLSSFLADPKLELYDAANRKLDENDNWSATLAPIFTSVGAFPLDANSKDAALYTVLAPGSYTVQVKGADGGTGEALVEVYEVP